MKRLLFPAAAPGALTLDGPGFHHLVRVLRVRAGDTLELFDGKGTVFPAVVQTLEVESARLEVAAGTPRAAMRELIIVQALPKADKLEWVLQKCTELGAAAFVPMFTERTVVKPSGREDGKLERWRKIVEEAARQCGRADVPRVEAPRGLPEAVRGLSQALVLVLDTAQGAAVSLSQAWAGEPSATRPVALVIGPEGGLSAAELEQLREAGAVPVTLGSRVLRTETAALSALAVLLHLQGELG
jgi:16S rRNA (uracil1498-N3)-methyltransferase